MKTNSLLCTPSVHTRHAVLMAMFGLLASLSLVSAATITMSASDSGTDNSFSSAGHWSNSSAPTSGNAYYAAYNIRTAAAAGDYTFAGDSLTLDTYNGGLIYKGTGGTITVANLSMNNKAFITNYASAFTLAGTITLGTTATNYFRTDGTNQGFTINALVKGSGSLSFINGLTTQATSAMTLASANNTYTGGTIIGAYSYVIVAADGALGTGNLTVNGGLLTLQSGVTNNYIADSATLSLATGLSTGAINLNYTGSDTIAKLSLDGGSTYLSAGVYDATALNSLYGSSAFTGTGTLTVVPEPVTLWMLALGLTVVLSRRRRIRNRHSHA